MGLIVLTRTCLGIALLATLPAWAQVSSPIAPAPGSGSGEQMAVPPPVSGQAYPTEVGGETRSNYLRGGLNFSTAYIDNMYPGSSASPTSEMTYIVLPTISFDQTTSRQHRMFTYSPGFTLYEPSSALNEIDQNATVTYQYRLTPHLSISANDAFQKSSTSFGASDAFPGGTVSGTPPPMIPDVFVPFAQRLTNTADAQFSLQYSPNGMIGASGTLMKLDYPNPSEVSGLYNSDMRGASAFFNRRISAIQYVGVNYQYARILAYPVNAQSETQTQTVVAYYTIYPKPQFSLSISGGPQHYQTVETSLPTTASWGPMVMVSASWRGRRASFAASYSQEVTAGGGLLGAFHSNSTTASAHWQASRALIITAGCGYTTNKSITPLELLATENGDSISGTASVEHPINAKLKLRFEYDRVYQSYAGIAAISNDPNSDRETISLAWQFTRPLGR